MPTAYIAAVAVKEAIIAALETAQGLGTIPSAVYIGYGYDSTAADRQAIYFTRSMGQHDLPVMTGPGSRRRRDDTMRLRLHVEDRSPGMNPSDAETNAFALLANVEDVIYGASTSPPILGLDYLEWLYIAAWDAGPDLDGEGYLGDIRVEIECTVRLT